MGCLYLFPSELPRFAFSGFTDFFVCCIVDSQRQFLFLPTKACFLNFMSPVVRGLKHASTSIPIKYNGMSCPGFDQREKWGTLGRVPEICTNIYHLDICVISWLYEQYRVIFVYAKFPFD